jgi:hypothetical protein
MRTAVLIAALAIVTLGLCSQASAQFFDGQSIIFGRPHSHIYQGAWCGHQDTGGGNVDEDCSFDSFEHCRFAVMGVNNGFCTPNPAFVGRAYPVRKKKKRHAAR